MHCLTTKRRMDFTILLNAVVMMGCFFMSVFPIRNQAAYQGQAQAHRGTQVQSKGRKVNNTLREVECVSGESMCFIGMCVHGSTNGKVMKNMNNGVMLTLDILLNEICSCGESTSFNSTFKFGLLFFNTTNDYLINVCCNESSCCSADVTNHVAWDKIFPSDLEYKAIKVRVIFIPCTETNLMNQFNYSCLDAILVKRNLGEIFHRKFMNTVDRRTILLILNLKNFSFGDLCLHKNFSYFQELRKLTILLKRKCRFIRRGASKFHLLKLHRIKRDTDGSELSRGTPQNNSPLDPKEDVSSSHTAKYGKAGIPKFNETAYRLFLEEEQLKQTLRIESEWAYLCLVFVSVLMVFSLWCLRGLHSRNTNKKLITHSDRDHFLTVKEVLYKKARYLPMFNHEGPLEEVYVHDCGTNTDTSRLDMIR